MQEPQPVRMQVVITGRVQGVGFRNYTAAKADLLGVTGWVCNVGDDQVEVVAEGDRESLDTLLTYLRRGPRAAFVTQVDLFWFPATGEFTFFDIGYSR